MAGGTKTHLDCTEYKDSQADSQYEDITAQMMI